MIALPYLSAIYFSGTDAGDFLHNQVSADVLALSAGESVYACYCEPKGRVLALMLISKVDNDYYVILSSALADSIAKRLKMYVMRSKVDIEVLAEQVIAGLSDGNSSDHEGSSTILIPLPESGQQLAIISRATSPGHDTNLSGAWKLSELQRGVCWLGPETSGQFLPQMLGFDTLGAVNYRKGCYPGQEIVARTHYLGKVKRHPRLLNCQLRGPMQPTPNSGGITIITASACGWPVVAPKEGSNMELQMILVSRRWRTECMSMISTRPCCTC